MAKVDPGVFDVISTLETAKEMYDYLHTSFQAQTLSSTVARLGELLDLKFNGKMLTYLLNHFGSVHKLITQLLRFVPQYCLKR